MYLKRLITGGILFCSLIVALTVADKSAFAMGWRHGHHASALGCGSGATRSSDSQTGRASIPLPKPSTIALIGSGLAAAKAYVAIKRDRK